MTGERLKELETYVTVKLPILKDAATIKVSGSYAYGILRTENPAIELPLPEIFQALE